MKQKTAFLAVGVLLLAAVLIGWAVGARAPENKAAQFVREHGAAFSALADSGQPIPATLDGIAIDTWDGAHLMYEFRLGTGTGDRQYWGVYYSPDDVPLPFQNTDVSLLPDGEGSWTWQAAGDNRGTTKKLAEKWYYFEAGF